MSINTTGAPPCQGNIHYFGPPTGLHSGQVCSCGGRYGETIEGKFRMHVTRLGSERDRLNLPRAPPACRYCERVVTRADLTEYQLQIWDDECGEWLDKFSACSDDRCRTLADKDVGDARMNFEQRRNIVIHNAYGDRWRTPIMLDEIPVAKAPTADALIQSYIDDIRRLASRPLMLDSDVQPSRRPDGFDQANVDAAKAVLLAQTPTQARGRR